MNTRITSVITSVLLLVFAVACGDTSNVSQVGNPQRGSSQFDLKVLDSSFVEGSSADSFGVSVEDHGEDVVVNIDVENATDLKALYIELAYDANQFRPGMVVPSDAMGNEDDMLTLHIFQERGVVHHGQVLTNYDWRTGFTGSGTVASVVFRKTPFPSLKDLSTPPTSGNSATELTFDFTDQLDWWYANIGDYNQDSLVTIADLTPLAANFNDSVAPALYPIDTAKSQVDGDRNGALNITDLTPLAANFGNAAAEWNIYTSGDSGDYPDGGSLLDTVPHANASGAAGTERLSFNYTVAAPVADAFYWVKASDGTTDGVESNLAGGNPANLPTIALSNPPGGGDGTMGNPYQVNITDNYIFQVTDPTDGDVSTSVDTSYTVSPGGAGSISNADATLNIEDGFTGTFDVSASYNSVGTSNKVYCNVQAAPSGDLFILPDSGDTDWDTVAGDGETEETAYILGTDTFNTDFMTEFALVANTESDGTGDSIDVETLEWFAFPPFAAQNYNTTPKGTFTVNTLTNGRINAEDGDMNTSNNVFIAVDTLPD